jgi:DedD protein
MPPEIQNDQALDLKKRARRRLVGAIALVIIMIIVLPMVIKDRAAPEVAKDDIKISMPATLAAVESNQQALPQSNTAEHHTEQTTTPAPVVSATELVVNMPDKANSTVPINDVSMAESIEKTPEPIVAPKEIKKPEVKTTENQSVQEKHNQKPAEIKPVVTKLAETKSADVKKNEEVKVEAKNGDFTIQIGVYSDAANVAQLQAKLKAAGFTSRTEKVSTPKGEKIRLRVGKYSTRQDAADALTTLNASGMTGMVITNK